VPRGRLLHRQWQPAPSPSAGVSAALYARAAGRAGGQHVAVSLLETGIALLGTTSPDGPWRQAAERNGSGVWHIVPYQAFRTADGWLLAGATNDAGLSAALRGARRRPTSRRRRPLATIASASPTATTCCLRAGSDLRHLGSGNGWRGSTPCRAVLAHQRCRAGARPSPQVAATEMVVEVPDGATACGCRDPLKMSGTPGGRPGARGRPAASEHSGAVLRTGSASAGTRRTACAPRARFEALLGSRKESLHASATHLGGRSARRRVSAGSRRASLAHRAGALVDALPASRGPTDLALRHRALRARVLAPARAAARHRQPARAAARPAPSAVAESAARRYTMSCGSPRPATSEARPHQRRPTLRSRTSSRC
jgi:hypothetical protein